MSRRVRWLRGPFTAVVVFGLGAAALAAPASAEVLIHVDGRSAIASDGNPGTADRPVATIGQAVRLADDHNAQGAAVTVRIAPGVYREHVRIDAGATDAPLTLEAAASGVTVTAADRFTQWRAHGSDTFVHPWPHTWGLEPMPSGWPHVPDLHRRREVVTVNDQQMRQVLTAAELDDHDGSFTVDEQKGQLILRPPEGIDPAAARVEVATRDTALLLNGRSNVTVRGITFSHAATRFQRAGVIVDGGSGIVLDDVTSALHSWAGLTLWNATDVTVRRSRIDGNGVVGIGAWRARNLLVEDGSASHNGWRAAWSGAATWENGNKLLHTRGIVIRGHEAVGNRGTGWWFDTDVQDVIVEDAFVARNDGRGFFIELSQGPFRITGTTVCENTVTGVLAAMSDDVLLERNAIFGNGQEQWTISGERGGKRITNWETGEQTHVRNQRWTLRDNVIVGTARLVRNNLNAEDWNAANASLRSEGNTWYSDDAVPFAGAGSWLDFAGWQAETGQDADSRFEKPAPTLTCAPPDGTAAPAPHEPDRRDQATEDSLRFQDVTAEHVHAASIERIADAGITTGCDADRYCPATPVSRAQMATFLARARQLDVTGQSSLEFSDVPPSHVHRPSILAVTAARIAQGCAPGLYCPVPPVTRGQMATLLTNALDLHPRVAAPFADVPDNHVHAIGIAAVSEAGIALGCGGGRFCPDQPVSRAQMAAFLSRALDTSL